MFVIYAISIGSMYSGLLGWLAVCTGMIVLSAVNGVRDYLHERRYDDPDA
jgi:hypothetical protein